ncbi:MAG: hypothetical protein ACRELC_09910 [Gemmatimonadota bacterium]
MVRRLLATILLCVAAASGGACSDSAPDARAEAEPAEHRALVIFVYDRSTSIPDHQLEHARELTRGRLLELRHGERIAAMQLLQLSLAEPPKRWSQRLPEREVQYAEIARDSAMRARFIADADVLLRQFSDPAARDDINGTDILSTLHDVAAEIRAYPEHEAALYLFSDMLQSNRSIEMEGLRNMPADGWIEEAKRDGRLPDLSGLCVVVVGARVDTEAAQRVKSFWDEYFRATGATLYDRNYALRPVRLPTDPCA